MKSISALMSVVALAAPGLGQTIPNLGTAASFGAIAVSTFENTGATFINGSIGTTASIVEISGFPPGVFTGIMTGGEHVTTPRADSITAFNQARSNPVTTAFDAHTAELTETTLTAGVYSWEQGASVNGVVTLDGPGLFVFSIKSTLTTTDNSEIVLTGGALATNVWWTVDGHSVLGVNSTLRGTLVSLSEIIVGSGAFIEGGIYGGARIFTTNNTITGPN